MSGRIRSIKPELLEDEKTAGLSSVEFRLFIGLLLLADDYGNMRGHPGRIHGAVFWASGEVTIANVAAALARLELAGLVRSYVVRGQPYLAVVNWAKHQKVDRPGKPRVPGPTESDASEVPDLPSQEPIANHSREIREPLATDQGSGIRDQGSWDHGTPNARAPARGLEGVESFETPFLRNEYERHVRKSVPDPGWTFPARQLAALRDVVRTRCPDRTKLEAWLATEIPRFVEAVRAKPGVYSAFGPDGFARWWNNGCPTEERASGTRIAPLAGRAIQPRSSAWKEPEPNVLPEGWEKDCKP